MKTAFFTFQTLFLAVLCLFSMGNPAEAKPFVILPGDVLQISVWKEEGMDQEVVVLPDGTITFPLIGTIVVQDMPPSVVQNEIQYQLQSMIPDAAVTVAVKAPLGHRVSVIGQVQKSGDIVLSTRTNVMQAISQTGGFTPYADEDDIVVVRTSEDGTKQSIPYPYDDLVDGDSPDRELELEPGDVIVVPVAGLF
jgi:polysaccharide export outer membrane protein